ncbi:MAG TPA: adenylyl-sulfate kinase [Kofleriaceae bacterium]|nr:adenylyl-sulfate kinase [Kofleriaceae bacterium]
MPPARNLTRHRGNVTRDQREGLLGQRGAVIWLTGLSGSGKSTLAYALESRLVLEERHPAYVLDGDNVRHGLCSDLGFSPGDRDENIRRVGEAAALFADAGVIAIAGFISPYEQGRERARDRAGASCFIEVYLDVPVSVCEERDPKGLYKKARAGEIPNFTGVSAPYEAPADPELRLDTAALDVEECVDQIVEYLRAQGFLAAPEAAPA